LVSIFFQKLTTLGENCSAEFVPAKNFDSGVNSPGFSSSSVIVSRRQRVRTGGSNRAPYLPGLLNDMTNGLLSF
jgi:hypothetical protein